MKDFEKEVKEFEKEFEKGFEARIFPMLKRISEALPSVPSDLAMFALAIALGERIKEENDDIEEREACLNIMMQIVSAGTEEDE